MEWVDGLGELDGVAGAVATIASYVLGFAWYSWSLFGKSWAGALGMTKEQADDTEGMGAAFVVSLVAGVAKVIVLALLMAATDTTGFGEGLLFGAIVGLALIASSIAYHNGFSRMSPTLTLIDSAHDVVEAAMVGAVIGLMA